MCAAVYCLACAAVVLAVLVSNRVHPRWGWGQAARPFGVLARLCVCGTGRPSQVVHTSRACNAPFVAYVRGAKRK